MAETEQQEKRPNHIILVCPECGHEQRIEVHMQSDSLFSTEMFFEALGKRGFHFKREDEKKKGGDDASND